MELNVKQLLCPESKWDIKCPYPMNPIGLTIHNTANDASDTNEISYMISNNDYTSYHYAVDDDGATQGLLLNRNGFHASDGATGPGNRQTIAIEICYSKSGGDRFTKAEINAAILAAHLCKQYGWTTANIKRHYDYAPDKKYCPHRTMDLGWDAWLDMVDQAMKGLNPSRSNGGSKPSTGGSASTGGSKKLHVYKINGVEEVNGIWQVRSNYLVPVGFTLNDNGIPLDDIDFVDINGNKLANQSWDGTQKYFIFRVGSVKAETGLIKGTGGYYWVQFESDHGEGTLWLSCDNLNDLYYRAYDNGQ